MYFVYRDGKYIDASGQSFKDYLKGKLPARPGELPTINDWADHITTAFPEVRLKRYLEMRGADGGPWRVLPSLSAFWVGLLYDDASLDAAWELVKPWNAEERQRLRDDVPRLGFKATIRNRDVKSLAGEALALARAGLKKRNRLDPYGLDETRYLAPLDDFVERGRTQAEELLEKFHGPWGGSVEPVFKEYAY
jgi:glutamate--cysteine ligase